MPGIICAIRGGPHSQGTVDEAIKLAIQTKLPLYFLHVIQLEFLSRTITNRVQIARGEIARMSDFILLTAEERAEERGVEKVSTLTVEGEIAPVLSKTCTEIGADYIVLGRPVGADEKNVFTHELIIKFVETIQKECHATVILAGDEPS